MENNQTSPIALPQANGSRFQWLPSQRQQQPAGNNDDEGGLNLGQMVSALRRRILVIGGVALVITSLALLRAKQSKPIYQASFEILTKPVTVENQVISSTVPQTLSNSEQESAKGVDQTKLKLLKSPRLLAPIVDQLKPKYPDLSAEFLAATLVVTPQTGSEIMSVSFQDGNPAKVKAVLELVSKAYLKYSLQERLADVEQGIEFVNAQLPQLQNRVETIQDQLQSFRQRYNLIDPESQGKKLTDQSTALSQQRLETQVRLSEARGLYQNLSNQLAQQTTGNAAASALSDNARYQKLLSQVLDVEIQTANESSLFLEKTPNIQVLRKQRETLLPLLQREGQRVQNEVASKIRELESRSQVLAQTEGMLNQQIKQLSVISRQYTDIQRELTIATGNLNQFLTKREALRIDAGQRKTPWQILTPPGEPFPSSADVKRSALLGAILGLLLGVGVALLLEKLSNVLHTADEVKAAAKLPILGVIPFNPELTDVEKLTLSLEKAFSLGKLSSLADLTGVMQQMRDKLGLAQNGNNAYHYASSPFLEAFRSLYTNIILLNPDNRVRSFVITSSTPGEGKSTVSVYLAQAAAALGQRVLLVDTDLRLPQLHNRLELDNTYGLSTIISDDLDFEQVVQPSLVDSNLSILTAGHVPPDPTRLLSSQKMQNLMEQFRAAYDLVIYDTPPLIGLADAKLLAPKTDGILMVTGLGKTKVSVLTQALDGLKLYSVVILGVVANGSKESSASIYNSYNRRYYKSDLKQSPDLMPLPVAETAPTAVKQSKES